jgi:carbonic anhydrase/acetyltransferase-like protein (isoleucine patch superfamily)
MILTVAGKTPVLGSGVWLAPDATLIGDVVLGDRASVWFGSVLRGDVGKIRIGAETNVQDLCVIHVDSGGFDCTLGDRVTIGHRVVLHGCTVGNLALIGIGSIVLNGAEIGEETMIGAGSLVTQGAKIPSGVLALGSPAKVKRPLTAEERAGLRESAAHYVSYTALYR